MKLSLIVAMASLAIAAPSSSSSWSGQDGKQSKCLQISDRDAKVFTDKVNTAFAQQKNWKKVAQEIYTDDVYSTSRSYPYAQNKKVGIHASGAINADRVYRETMLARIKHSSFNGSMLSSRLMHGLWIPRSNATVSYTMVSLVSMRRTLRTQNYMASTT